MIEDATAQRRATDWNALFAAETTADQLADIAERHPEFAPQIAQHPNCYDDLRAWADGVSAEATPVAVSTVMAAPAVVAPRTAAPSVAVPTSAAPVVGEPAPSTSEALVLDYGTRREHLLWGGAFLLWLLVILVEAISGLLGGPPWLRLSGAVASVLVIASAIVTGRSAGRKVAGAALGIPIALSVFAVIGSGGSSVVFALLSWMVATRRSGLIAVAIPLALVIGNVQAVVQAGMVSSGWFNFDWPMRSAVLSLIDVVMMAVTVAFAVWMDRLRARPRALAEARRAEERPHTPPLTAAGDASRTNTLAVLSLVLSLVGMSLVAIVLGHVAHSQIRRTGEQGKGLATAGLVIGYVALALTITVFILAITTSIFAAFNSSFSSY